MTEFYSPKQELRDGIKVKLGKNTNQGLFFKNRSFQPPEGENSPCYCRAPQPARGTPQGLNCQGTGHQEVLITFEMSVY